VWLALIVVLVLLRARPARAHHPGTRRPVVTIRGIAYDAVLEICPECAKSEPRPGPAARPVALPHAAITGGPR